MTKLKLLRAGTSPAPTTLSLCAALALASAACIGPISTIPSADSTEAQAARATALAALPTQPPAPAAAGVPIQGRLLVATTRPSPRPRSDLSIDYRLAWLSSRGLEPIRLPGETDGVGDAAVAPDGSEIAVIVGGNRVLRLGREGNVLGDLAPTLGQLTASSPDGYLSIAWMPPSPQPPSTSSGQALRQAQDRLSPARGTTQPPASSTQGARYLLRQTAPAGLQVVEVAGPSAGSGQALSRQQLPGRGINPSVAPDGVRLALEYVREELFYSIHVADLAFSDVRKLTADQVTEAAAAWSPDGQWIAYAANAGFADQPRPSIAWELRVIRPDGTGQRTLIPRLPGVSYSEIRWAPDSQRIAFTRVTEDPAGRSVQSGGGSAVIRQIGVVSLALGEERMLSDGHASDRVLGWVD